LTKLRLRHHDMTMAMLTLLYAGFIVQKKLVI